MSQPAIRRSPWALPALLALGSMFALIAALAADGIWDVLSWLLLALPVVVVCWASIRKRR
jgi:hypothetical protein